MARPPIGRDRRLDKPLATVELTLPLPPSPNDVPANPMAEHRAKRAYQRKAWARACETARPFRDPPARVYVITTLYVMRARDPDNLSASLKWLLDALRQRQQGQPWRAHHQHCGYMVDDDPEHLALGPVSQVVVTRRKDQRAIIEITWGTALDEIVDLPGMGVRRGGLCR